MSTQVVPATRPPAPAARGGGLSGALRSELTKLRTVRSTYWSLLVAVLAAVGIGALATAGTSANWDQLSAEDRATFDVTSVSLAGLFLAQLAIGVLGVLSITSEYSTGSIRSTLSAVPRRPVVLLAKSVVFGAVALAVGLIASFAAFLLGAQLLSAHVSTSLGDPGVLRAVVGGGLYLAVLGLLGLALGALLRSTPGAIAALFGLVFVLPIVANFLPRRWHEVISEYDPADAGSQVLAVHREPGTLPPWGGFALFCAYAVVTLVVAGVVMSRRDA